MSAARTEEYAAHAATLDLLAAIAARNYQEVDQVSELRIARIARRAAIGRGNVTGHHAVRIGSDRKAGFLESRNRQLMVHAGGRLGAMPPEGGQAACGQRASRACEKRENRQLMLEFGTTEAEIQRGIDGIQELIREMDEQEAIIASPTPNILFCARKKADPAHETEKAS